MALHITESIWLNATDTCTLEHLIEVSGLDRNDLLTLVEADVIPAEVPNPEHYLFRSDSIVLARTARRLKDDFELNTDGLILAVSLVQRIHRLEAKLAAADAKKGRQARILP
ncbi:MAG: hypothetical protein KA735_00240 [Burkholderiaceae bacterium]|nr:hypothetical protein [Burkholderiaceae bacterium]